MQRISVRYENGWTNHNLKYKHPSLSIGDNIIRGYRVEPIRCGGKRLCRERQRQGERKSAEPIGMRTNRPNKRGWRNTHTHEKKENKNIRTDHLSANSVLLFTIILSSATTKANGVFVMSICLNKSISKCVAHTSPIPKLYWELLCERPIEFVTQTEWESEIKWM